MSIELPPLPPEISCLPRVAREEIAARERILLARIAELERLWRLAEDRYALADAAAMSHAKRIAELQDQVKDLRKADEALEENAERMIALRNILHGAVSASVFVNDAALNYETPKPGRAVQIIIYQDTSVGSVDYFGDTLDAAIDAAIRGKK